MKLIFIKLGGSLITDKHNPSVPNRTSIMQLATEIADALRLNPELKLIIGHGSGSFGHVPAKKYDTYNGAYSPAQWQGFIEVWKEARTLNQIIIDALFAFDLPILAFPPSAALISENRMVTSWDLTPLEKALQANLIPLINGDVVFDTAIGCTILSTEELFFHLATIFQPERILLAGLDYGVYNDYPECNHLLELITPETYSEIKNRLKKSAAVDVTGGMLQKVQTMIDLIIRFPKIQASIFSGTHPGNLMRALQGATPGTTLRHH
ncbi:MAG: isopentenyl phosphate kinase [Anaerolineaceae bacterium]|nr:isopentenyl phosphate kinase [Anaerolineaceae bacterium]